MRLTLSQLKQIIQEELDADLNEIGQTLPEWPQWVARATELLDIFAKEVGPLVGDEVALQAMAEAIKEARRAPGDEVSLKEKCGPEHADE